MQFAGAQIDNTIGHGQRPRIAVDLMTGNGQRRLQIGLGKLKATLAARIRPQFGHSDLHLVGLGLETRRRLPVAVMLGALGQRVEMPGGLLIGQRHVLHIRPGMMPLFDEVHGPVVAGPVYPLVRLPHIGMAATEEIGEQQPVAQLIGVEAALHEVMGRDGQGVPIRLPLTARGLLLLFFGNAILHLPQEFSVCHRRTSVAVPVCGRGVR